MNPQDTPGNSPNGIPEQPIPQSSTPSTETGVQPPLIIPANQGNDVSSSANQEIAPQIPQPSPETAAITPPPITVTQPTSSNTADIPTVDSTLPTQPIDPIQPAASGTQTHGKTIASLHKHESPVGIVVIAVVLLLAVFNVFFTVHVLQVRKVAYNALPSTQATIALEKFGPAVENRPSGTLDLSDHINASLSAHSQNISAGLKQQVNLDDGESLMVNSYQANWQPVPGSGLIPATGDYYILLNMVVGNRSTEDQSLNSVITDTAILNGQTLLNTTVYPFSDDFSNTATILCSDIDLDQFNPGQQEDCAEVVQVPNNSLPKIVFSDPISFSLNDNPLKVTASITL